MITYRCAQPDEYREYLDLANTVFNQHGVPINFATAIPKVYAPELADETAAFQHVAIDEKGRFNALIAALPGQLHIGDQLLNYGYIGTVSVHPSCRGEGYMKHLMQDALVDMQARQADFMILGGQRQRYQYFGYNKGGISWHVDISKRNIKHYLREVDASDIGFKPICLGTEEEKQAQRMHEQQDVWYDRRHPGFAPAAQTYGGVPYLVTEGKENVGYIVTDSEGKRFCDFCLPSITLLHKVLKAWQEKKDVNSILLSLPDWERSLLRELNYWCEQIECGPQWMIRILHYRKVVEILLRWKSAYTVLSDGEVGFEAEGECFTVRVKDGQVTVSDGAEHPIVLPDAQSAGRVFLSMFDWIGRPAEVPSDWFPLPFFCPMPDEF